jgi:S-adenosyl methyltransferase
MLPADNVMVANAAGKYEYLLSCYVASENRNQDASGHIAAIYVQAIARLVMRTKHEISRFFPGFKLVEPGFVYQAQWRRVAKCYTGGGARWGHAGAGGKTRRSANAGATNDAAFPRRDATRRSP